MYDINQSEGFNLRRDVFLRMATFIRHLNQISNYSWILVLPPWNQLYHWRSMHINQDNLPWSLFFNLDAIKKTTPIIETHEFVEINGLRPIDVYVTLQHYRGLSDPNHDWSDKWEVTDCVDIKKNQVWNYTNLTSLMNLCLSFQGPSSLLIEIINDFNPRTIMFNHAEVILHDYYGGSEYWLIRKSMQFATDLKNIANTFKTNFLLDKYLCVHLRRRDFLYGRPQEVPSIEWAASQILEKLQSLKNLKFVFVSTDASDKEFYNLKELLIGYNVIKYDANEEILKSYKDGGVAIIDQIICSQADYFIGTHESTFSFRIQEEREILGFHPETTFNRLCGDKMKDCAQPSKWRLVT
ncbi:GDP-fucose protein O-fucosyltransferase 2 isoform X2 [Daktulosphaira vitifoliae]|nr:GDP-fucose protein O-fucosyltransferase 2 isoform X2 [Daktulosphaira vitifoliae]